MANTSSWSGWSARQALLRPVWWLALGLLLLNDHYFKGAGVLAPLVTGKLSDFAGLLMAPAVLAAVLFPRSRRAFVLAHVGLGVAFTALKLSPACAAAWCSLGAAGGLSWRVVSDPSDLLALPVLGLSYWCFGARLVKTTALGGWRRVASATGCGLGFVGIVATSKAPQPPPLLGPTNEGKLYVAAGRGWLELNRDTGTVIREVECEWAPKPRIAGGVLYAARGTTVGACDLATGRELWTRDLEMVEIAHVDSERLVVHDRSHLWVLAASSGITLWEREVVNGGVFVLADHLMVHDNNRALELLALADGKRLGRRGWLAPRPIVHQGQLWGFQGNALVVLDAEGGPLRRAEPGLSSPEWAASAFPGDTLLALSHPNDGKLARESALVALAADNLQERWRVSNAEVLGITQDLVFTHRGMTCDANTLTARDAASGRATWSMRWCPWSDALTVDEKLLIWSSDSADGPSVAARDAHTGRPVWHTLLDD